MPRNSETGAVSKTTIRKGLEKANPEEYIYPVGAQRHNSSPQVEGCTINPAQNDNGNAELKRLTKIKLKSDHKRNTRRIPENVRSQTNLFFNLFQLRFSF